MSKITNPIESARHIIEHGPDAMYQRMSGQHICNVLEAMIEQIDSERKLLGSALQKFAPDLAEQLVQRWHIAISKEDERLKNFLDVLRK